MPPRPTTSAWKQVLPIAIVVLAVGFYGQYTRASGVFAADGLIDQAEQLVQQLLTPAPNATPEALPAELAVESIEVASPTAEAFASDFRAGPHIPPSGASFTGRVGGCSSNHCR